MSGLYHNKALPKGAVLREWRLEEVLGVGGFGIVYRGKSLYFDEQVAIKEYFPGAISDRVDDTTVAPNDSSAEETYALGLSKFLEEAKVLWNLSRPERHPNIVSVRSLFEIHGTAYMVMDFETGKSLSQMLKDGKTFTEAELLGMIRPIANGLDRAHRGGVLHRDIKPANIIVDDTGRPVLIDFGSARFDSGQATSTKVTFYTPPYAAIEQYVKTFPQGPWTDIYALGVTLYECVAGKKPPEVLERLHGDEDEALSAREWPGFSRTFTQAVDAAMAIKPAERPQSIPQWLQMFEASQDAPAIEESTRVAVMRDSLPEPEPVKAEAPPAADKTIVKPLAKAEPAAAPRPAPAKTLAEPRKARRGPALVVIGVAGLAAAGLIAAFSMGLFGGKPAAVVGGPADTAAPVAEGAAGDLAAGAAGASTGAGAVAAVATDLESLAASARRFGRPAKEVGALSAASRKVAAVAAQIAALPPGPEAAAQATTLVNNVNRIAGSAAKAQGTALVREAAALLSGVQASPAWSGPSTAPVRKAKAALDSAVAAISRAPDANAAIAATGRAFAANQAFGAAFANAQPALVSAQKDAVRALQAQAKQAAGAISDRAAGPKPGVFASKAKKDEYKTAQDNAAQAKARLADVDRVAQSGLAASELSAVDATVAQLGPMVRELEAMKAASAASAAQP